METKFTTPEDKAEYDKFFAHHILQIARSKAASKVCHYTTGDTLIKILDSGELWSTQIACLNDSKEALFAVEALQATIKGRRARGVDPKFEPCLRAIEKQIEGTTTESVGIFVTCFSSELDDLSQWRGYGGEAGYAIVFDVGVLGPAAAMLGDAVLPVLYGLEAEKLLDDSITWAQNFYLEGLAANRAPTDDEWTEEFSRMWLWHLAHFAPMIKNSSFRGEKEWRQIHFLLETDATRLKFLQRRSMMTRHLPMPLRAVGDTQSRLLPIESIIVGPTGNRRLSQLAIGDLLKARGYSDKVEVTLTNIPYRPYL